MTAKPRASADNRAELLDTLDGLRQASAGTGDERGDTRERLLTAAITLFNEVGAHATTIRRLATAVGITPGAVYAHFASKEEVLTAAAARSYVRFIEQVVLPIDPPGREGRLLGLCRRHMLFQCEEGTHAAWTDTILAGTGDQMLSSDVLTLIRQAQAMYVNEVRTEVARVRAFDDLEVEVETESILALCDSLSGSPRPQVLTPVERIDRYLVIIMRSLGHR